MLTFERLTVALDDLPELVRSAAQPDSPTERRLLLARATVPMDPPEMLATLAFLVSDPAEMVSSAAKATLQSMPPQLLMQAIRQSTSQGVLDIATREIQAERSELLEDVIQNKSAADETVAYISFRGEGNVLDIISKNQMRLKRYPKIVEAIYFNPNARMGLVLNLLEDAVRLDLDMTAIPGYDEIVASIKGGAKRGATVAPQVEPPEPAPPGVPDEPEKVFEADEDAQPPADWLTGGDEDASGVDDDVFSQVLASVSSDNPEEAGDGPLGRNLLSEIPKMSVPQKVRLALLGNEAARRVLIRDNKRVVYMSVMKSPRLSDKEIADYAKNKALNEEVIRMIATNREWTHNYSVKMALIEHPKCPSALAIGFLRLMQVKDIKTVARSHDVPGYMARAAKGILDAMEAGKKF